jgi:hypothetical protein
MNQDTNKVDVPKGAVYKDKGVLKVLQAVIGDTAKDTGYKVLLDDGSAEFISQSQFEKLAEPKEEEEQ